VKKKNSWQKFFSFFPKKKMNPLLNFDPCNEATQLVFVLTQLELSRFDTKNIKNKYITKRGTIQDANRVILEQIGYKVETTEDITKITDLKEEVATTSFDLPKEHEIIVLGYTNQLNNCTYSYPFGNYTIVYELVH
jgi:hypothetical protein